MPYSREVVRRARQKLEFARGDRESQARQRLQEVYAALPRVREIDIQLRRSMALAAQSVFNGGQDAESTFDTVKQANLSLQQERRQLIDSRFGAGYLDESPICPRCGGTGYIGTETAVNQLPPFLLERKICLLDGIECALSILTAVKNRLSCQRHAAPQLNVNFSDPRQGGIDLL